MVCFAAQALGGLTGLYWGSTWVWVIIGVGGGIVLLAILSILCTCCRRRNRAPKAPLPVGTYHTDPFRGNNIAPPPRGLPTAAAGRPLGPSPTAVHGQRGALRPVSVWTIACKADQIGFPTESSSWSMECPVATTNRANSKHTAIPGGC